MAKHSLEDRVEDIKRRAADAVSRAQEYQARAERYRAQGKTEKAAAAEATVRRQETIASNHRMTLVDLETRLVKDARERGKIERQRSEMRARIEREKPTRSRPDSLQIFTEALRHAAELEDEQARHDKAARGYRRAGDQGKAEREVGNATKKREMAAEWRTAAQEEAERARETEQRDLPREHAIARKAAERAEAKARKESKRLSDLHIEGNLETSAAQREIRTSGERSKRVVSMATFGELLRRPQDRTPDRLEAMKDFDELCDRADAGLIPETRFEHESGSGKGPGDRIMAARADGLREMQEISAAIGVGNVTLLRARINQRMKLSAIAREGIGTESTIGQLFVSAVDALVVYRRTKSALHAVSAGMGVPLKLVHEPKARKVEQDPTYAAYRSASGTAGRHTFRPDRS